MPPFLKKIKIRKFKIQIICAEQRHRSSLFSWFKFLWSEDLLDVEANSLYLSVFLFIPISGSHLGIFL